MFLSSTKSNQLVDAGSGKYEPCVAPKKTRVSDRTRTVCRVAHVRGSIDEGFARVTNISDSGIGLKLSILAQEGDELGVHLSDEITLRGRVVWTKETDCGLHLDVPIKSDVLLKQLADEAKSVKHRPLRLPLEKAATVQCDGLLSRVYVRDLSLRGMKLQHNGSLEVGRQVKVTLAIGMERLCVVRWNKGCVAGLMLLEPFSAVELGSVQRLMAVHGPSVECMACVAEGD